MSVGQRVQLCALLLWQSSIVAEHSKTLTALSSDIVAIIKSEISSGGNDKINPPLIPLYDVKISLFEKLCNIFARYGFGISNSLTINQHF